MASRVDWYLVELERGLSDFPQERRDVLLIEVECHLREQMDEMVAAGLAAPEADKETVRVFGEPSQFAERLRAETGLRQPRESEVSLRGTANSTVSVVAAVVMFGAGMSVLAPSSPPLAVVWGGICFAVLVLGSVTSKRISLGSILASIVAGGFAASLALGFAFVDYGALDGYNVSPVLVAYDHAQYAQYQVPDPWVPGASYFASEALAVPPLSRAAGFGRFGFLTASVAILVPFLVWIGRQLREMRKRHRWRKVVA